LTIEFESDDGGASTRLTQSIELVFPRGMRLLARLLGGLFLRQRAATAVEDPVQNAKRVVESETTHTA